MRTREQILSYQLDYRIKNKERVNQQVREWRINKKIQVFTKYGLQCNCCGENDFDKLTIDHINNDGKKHRIMLGGGDRIYNWLIKNNFPNEYQTLCMNCNKGKYLNSGICPHKELKEKKISNRFQSYKIRLREKIFAHYGRECVNCKESNIIFLSVDHINEDGYSHRKSIGNSSASLHEFLKKNNFPEGYQILCHSCNLKKYRIHKRVKPKVYKV